MSRNLRILHICSSQAWGGGEISAVKLAKRFQERGNEVVFATKLNTRIMQELQTLNVETVSASFMRHFDPVSVFKLVGLLKHRQIDIVHVHLSRDLVHAYWAVKLGRKVPLVLQKQVSSNINKKDFLHRQIYSQVSEVFVLSNFLKQNIIDTCPISGSKVVVIPGGVRSEDFVVSTETRNRIRKELGISSDELVFGTVGRIDRGKGYEELLNAFDRLVRKKMNVKLVIVGEPTIGETAFAAEMKSLIKKLGIESDIVFTGYRSDIPQILSAFDAFVLASYNEAFGYVIVEALASKLPVIGTNTGGVPDIIQDNENGLLVPPGDANSLMNAMLKLYNDEKLRNRFSISGYERVKKYFDENAILNRIEDEYYKLIDILSL
ncbi:MAG: glycosyltransferase family 4 protein [Bacteroidota bacterium]|nr:glycosyltransferase family 4 protein [Bacteroidota bacterium]